jgi:hypothetical protein
MMERRRGAAELILPRGETACFSAETKSRGLSPGLSPPSRPRCPRQQPVQAGLKTAPEAPARQAPLKGTQAPLKGTQAPADRQISRPQSRLRGSPE